MIYVRRPVFLWACGHVEKAEVSGVGLVLPARQVNRNIDLCH